MNSRIYYLLFCLFTVSLFVVPTSLAQTDDALHLIVLAEALNIREGPGVTYPAIGVLYKNFEVPISGRDLASGWWQVTLPDGREVWVTNVSVYVQVEGDTAGVPSIAPAAVPVVQPEPIPTVSIASVSTGDGTIVFQTVSGGPIYAVNADGSNLRYLTTGLDPAISSDGRWVAFSR